MIVTEKKALKDIIKDFKNKGKNVLIKRGVFDIIHPGHIYAIKTFKKHCDILIILIMSDELVQIKKGDKRPINSQEHRMKVSDGLSRVDYVYPDSSRSREEYIELLYYLKPSIVAVTKGDTKKTKMYSSKLWTLKEFSDVPGYSTTEIIEKISDRSLLD